MSTTVWKPPQLTSTALRPVPSLISLSGPLLLADPFLVDICGLPYGLIALCPLRRGPSPSTLRGLHTAAEKAWYQSAYPVCPESALPQQYTLPYRSMAAVCRPPQEIRDARRAFFGLPPARKGTGHWMSVDESAAVMVLKYFSPFTALFDVKVTMLGQATMHFLVSVTSIPKPS
jgi:hypothetical protein